MTDANELNSSLMPDCIRITIVATMMMPGMRYAKTTALPPYRRNQDDPPREAAKTPLPPGLAPDHGYPVLSDIPHADLMLHEPHELPLITFISTSFSVTFVTIPLCETRSSMFLFLQKYIKLLYDEKISIFAF